MKLRGQRGAGNFGAIVAVVLFALFVYVMFKVVPHFMNNYEMEDFMKAEARFLSYGQRSEGEARSNITNKAETLNIPADTLKVTKEGRRVRMNLTYTVNIEFPGYTFSKDFVIAVDNVGV